MSSEQRNPFLPKPPWRTRVGAGTLWAAIAVTFAVMVAIGLALFGLVVVVLDYADAPGWLLLALWLLPTAWILVWAVRGRIPATASDYEAQSWSDYSVRAVMIGIEHSRPVPARIVTAVLFGAPLGVWIVVGVLLDLLGIM